MEALFDDGPPPPCPSPFNMAAYVLAADGVSDDECALEVLGPSGLTMTYGALRRAVAGIATGLTQAGLHPGDRVMLRIGNAVEFPLAYLGAIWAGLVPIPTSAQLTAPEVAKLIELSGPRALIAGPGVALPRTALPIIGTDALADMAKLAPCAPQMGDPNRLGYIIFTSGTSGSPRGVCHAHRAIWARRMMHEGWYGLRHSDRMMHAGAFNWTYTLGTGLMDPWSVGATALIPAEGTPVEALPGLMAQHEASIFATAPGVYRKILKYPLPELPALRHGLAAGEHLSEGLRQSWRSATGRELHQALGMTECSTFISSSPARPAPPDCSGFPQPGRRVAVLRGGQPAKYGEEGILAVSSKDPGLMLGYLGADPVQGPWFETGDSASMSPDGAITYLGRGDDMMNAGGFRVSPLEVERCFAGLSGIEACGAVQTQVKQHANVIALCYQAEVELDEHQLRAHAAEHLARYKQPRLYIRLASLPYAANGKLNRRALRARLETSHAPDD